MQIGEAGRTQFACDKIGTEFILRFKSPLTDPLLFLHAVDAEGHPKRCNVVAEKLDMNGDTKQLTLRVKQGKGDPEVLLSWCVVSQGMFTLPDGSSILCGRSKFCDDRIHIPLGQSFGSAPQLFSQSDDCQTFGKSRLRETKQTPSYFTLTNRRNASSGKPIGLNWLAVDMEETITAENTVEAIVMALTGKNVWTGEHVTFQADTADFEAMNTGTLLEHQPESVVRLSLKSGLMGCFAGRTLIQTPDGDVAAQDLKAGDLVVLADGGTAPLRQVLLRTLTADDLRKFPDLKPIRIEQGALGEGLPQADLCVSPQYRLLVRSSLAQDMFGSEEVLVSAAKLASLPGVSETAEESVTYAHLVFDDHQIIFVEGAPAESMCSGKEALENLPLEAKSELLTLFPELGQIEISPVPARKIPAPYRQRRLVEQLVEQNKPLVEDRQIDQRVIRLKLNVL